MRKGLYAFTRPNIVSMRVSDDEMENIRQLMELTDLKTSEIMRRAFQLLTKRIKETGGWDIPAAIDGEGKESPCRT